MKELPIKLEGIIYRTINDRIEYLLIKRTPEDGGFWQPVTGTLEDGENLINCLKREISEEIGITEILRISDILHTFNWEKKDGTVITEYVYAVEIKNDSIITLSPNEHDDYIWLPYSEAKDTLLTDNNKESLRIINGFLTIQ